MRIMQCGLAALALIGGVTQAQSPPPAYPVKPVRIVTVAPGSANDLVARLVAQELKGPFGQPVIVDNRGTIAAEVVSKAPADGYTLLLAPSTFSIAQLVLKTGSGSGYDVVNGFTPIIQTALQPLFIAGATPLYGTCCSWMPAMLLSISPSRWLSVPLPAEAYW